MFFIEDWYDIFVGFAFPKLYGISDVYRFLCYGNRHNIAMKDEEKLALQSLLGLKHCMDVSTGFKEGDSIKIIAGALVGLESKIIRINKKQRYAVVGMELFGSVVETTVGFKYIEVESVENAFLCS